MRRRILVWRRRMPWMPARPIRARHGDRVELSSAQIRDPRRGRGWGGEYLTLIARAAHISWQVEGLLLRLQRWCRS